MRIILMLVVTFAGSFLTGCSTMVKTNASGMEALQADAPQAAAPESVGSLFASDQAVMSNQDIEKILTSKVYPPAHERIAVVRIGGSFPWGRTWWSESVAQVEQKGADRMLNALRGSPRVGKVMVLPTMLTPTKATVPYLREAAARVQADSLLVYRTFTQTYQQERFFGGGDVHAFCTVEAVLLDVRSGIVTDTAVKTQSFSAAKTSKDVEFEETTARAEQQAIADALGKAVEDLVRNLNDEPVMPTTRKGPPE